MKFFSFIYELCYYNVYDKKNNSGDYMKKITIYISDNSLVFKYRTNKPVKTNLLNTNVISNNELVFSDEYLANNLKIVKMFIGDLFKEKDITNVEISNNDMADLVLDILKDIDEIKCLTLSDDTNLSYQLCEKIANLRNIKKLNCYAIPTFMIDMLDKIGIEVYSRNEVLFTSDFMQINNLNSYSDMYYKNSITITDVLNQDDINDLKTFCTINKYLKIIHLEKFSMDFVDTITSVLKSVRKKNILIQIHDDINDEDTIIELRNMNKDLKKKYKIKLSLVYSKDYLEKNYLKQIIFTTLKICSLIIFAIVGSVLGYIFYNNYQSEKKVDAINEDLKILLSEDRGSAVDPGPDVIKPNMDNNEEPVIINSYDKLLEVNTDSVGWLTVGGTKIDYPVLQTTDNSYYLNRNFYKEKDYNGWVFMDYRNNSKELDSNTIIYAHNRYYSGVMFGTLNNVTKKNWYTNEENLYITFNTLYEEKQWKVFSIYGIDVTNDYLYTTFNDEQQHQEYIDLVKGRSIYDFATEVTTEDKILTLSTCLDNNKRLVVHAVLVDNMMS